MRDRCVSGFLDTRPTGVTVDTGDQAAGKQPAGTQTRLQITGRPGVPADATAVELNITAVQPELLGFITIHPCQTTRPNTSSLNYVRFVNGGNDIVATLDSAGGICIYTSATTHLTVDVTAHVTPA